MARNGLGGAMHLELWLLLGSAWSSRRSRPSGSRTGPACPSLLLYLVLGLLLGESGFGIQFDDAELADTLGLAALVLILAEGGLTTRWANVRPLVPAASALATVGIAVSIMVVAAASHWLLGPDWRTASLLGAVLAPTDAAAVFSVLRRLPLPRRAHRSAGGRVGPQRRPDRHPGDGAVSAGAPPGVLVLVGS